MKNTALVLMLFLAVTASCNQNTTKTKNSEAQTTAAAVSPTDATVVNVFYFHGKQRCTTCIAVGNVAKATVGKAFADNSKVVFTEVNTSEAAAKALVEKYGVTWNALIIAKGDDAVDITQQAFATAIANPQSLEQLIKAEVNKRLAN